MLVLDGLSALWFWAQFSSVLSLSFAPAYFLPAVAASEGAWFTPDSAWFDLATAEFWKRHWLEKMGCCVEFVFDAQDSNCNGAFRLVNAKSLYATSGWRTGFVVTTCGYSKADK